MHVHCVHLYIDTFTCHMHGDTILVMGLLDKNTEQNFGDWILASFFMVSVPAVECHPHSAVSFITKEWHCYGIQCISERDTLSPMHN